MQMLLEGSELFKTVPREEGVRTQIKGYLKAEVG